jgi:hypothetical protein
MGGIRWQRWAPASGIAYVVLSVVGTLLALALDDEFSNTDSDEEIVAFFADSGNRAVELASGALYALGVLFFLWVRERASRSAAGGRVRAEGPFFLAFGAGVASGALLMAAISVFSAIPAAVGETDRFVLDPNLARLVENAAFLLFVGSSMVASVLVAATSVLALRTAVLPRWLGWVGLVLALVLLVAVFFFPIFALWAWAVLVSVYLIVRAPITHPAEQGVSTPR